jgi:aminoglycoside phosphotransferase (APT) family kinase protein
MGPSGEDPAFAAALTALAPRFAGAAKQVKNVRRLSGGASQETWAFDAGDKSYILRRAHPGTEEVSLSNSSMAVGLAAEAQLMTLAGAAGVPSPAVRHVLVPEDGIGRGFIQDFVSGETLGGRIVKDAKFADARVTLARQCGEILARIHAIPTGDLPPLPVKSPRDHIAQLREMYRTEAWPRPVFELAFKWLEARAPEAVATPRLAHGDFRNGNLIIDETGVVAVLDWELAHLGDPLHDFGWLCANSWRFGAIDKPVGGFGSREDLVAGYEAAGGATVDLERVRFWQILGSLRWGIICTLSAVGYRAANGKTPVDRPMIARRTSETELDLVDLMMGAD